jgi:hypothetical protein
MKFKLGNFLSVGGFMLIMFGILFIMGQVALGFGALGDDELSALESIGIRPSGAGGYTVPIIMIIAGIIMRIPSEKIMSKAVEENDYDENGLSANYNSYLKLSKKERDELDKQRLVDQERIISAAALKKITKEGSKTPYKDLKKLTGLDTVKEAMKQMAARMEFDRKNKINI